MSASQTCASEGEAGRAEHSLDIFNQHFLTLQQGFSSGSFFIIIGVMHEVGLGLHDVVCCCTQFCWLVQNMTSGALVLWG